MKMLCVGGYWHGKMVSIQDPERMWKLGCVQIPTLLDLDGVKIGTQPIERHNIRIETYRPASIRAGGKDIEFLYLEELGPDTIGQALLVRELKGALKQHWESEDKKEKRKA